VTTDEIGQIFTRIYESNVWGFGSGHGSRLKETAGYRQLVEDFVAQNGIRSVVDYGCGDWNLAKEIDWGRASYLGLDVVGPLVDRLRDTYGRTGVEFDLAPSDPADLPPADLLIVKDVLQHHSNAMISEFLERGVPRYRYALITNDVEPRQPLEERVNVDIPAGEWRPLDLRVAPFHARATAIYLFHGEPVRNWRQRRMFMAWTKMVLLIERA
jgi:SAM-dependent methyltransferase